MVEEEIPKFTEVTSIDSDSPDSGTEAPKGVYRSYWESFNCSHFKWRAFLHVLQGLGKEVGAL